MTLYIYLILIGIPIILCIILLFIALSPGRALFFQCYTFFSECNIEKLRVAWGRGYNFHIDYSLYQFNAQNLYIRVDHLAKIEGQASIKATLYKRKELKHDNYVPVYEV